MNTSLLQFALCSSLFGFGEETDAVDAAIREAAGITLVTKTTGAVPTSEKGVFYVPGLERIEWLSDSLQTEHAVEFLHVPGTEGFFGAPPVGAHEDGYAAWRWELEVPAWSAGSTRLRLDQARGGATAEGRISLAVPRRLRERHALETIEVSDILSGCAMTPAFGLSFTLGQEARELLFTWDLHSLVNIDGVYMTLMARGLELPRIPIELEVPEAPILFEPGVLEFDSDRVVTLEVRGGSGQTIEVTKITCPACVRIAETETPKGGVRFRFEECGIARLRHDCGSIEIETLVGDDPEPFLRDVPVAHRRGLVDEDGSRPVFGAFAPGERIVVVSDRDGRVRLKYPDRVPCLAEAAGSSDASYEVSYQVPFDGRSLDVHVQGKSGLIHLRGIIDNKVIENLPRWMDYCSE